MALHKSGVVACEAGCCVGIYDTKFLPDEMVIVRPMFQVMLDSVCDERDSHDPDSMCLDNAMTVRKSDYKKKGKVFL